MTGSKYITPLEFARLQAELKLTDDQLAAELGVSRSTIAKRRAGDVKISKEVKLAMRWIRFEKGHD